MPNSNDVSSGDDVLATQYNDLRKDAVHPTLGHKHDGVSDGTLIPPASVSPQGVASGLHADLLDGLHGSGYARVITDTTANRPAAGNMGTLFIASDTKGLYWDDGANWRRVPQTLDYNLTEANHTGTGFKTIYTYTIPAGNIVIGSGFRLTLGGGVVNNTGVTRYVQWQIGLGGYTQNSPSMAIVTNAAGREFYVQVTALARAATTMEFSTHGMLGQHTGGNFIWSDVGAQGSGGIYINSGSWPSSTITGLTTTAVALTMKVALNINSPSTLFYQQRFALLELIPAPSYS